MTQCEGGTHTQLDSGDLVPLGSGEYWLFQGVYPCFGGGVPYPVVSFFMTSVNGQHSFGSEQELILQFRVILMQNPSLRHNSVIWLTSANLNIND